MKLELIFSNIYSTCTCVAMNIFLIAKNQTEATEFAMLSEIGISKYYGVMHYFVSFFSNQMLPKSLLKIIGEIIVHV